METSSRANEMGSIVVVHAHGDNQDLLREYVPKLRNVIGTTQTRRPMGFITLEGSQTVIGASISPRKYLGASDIKLIGFDLMI